MKQDEIFEVLKEIIFDIKGELEVTKDLALIENEIMDSLELINYLTQIEEKLDINVSFDELVDLKLGIIDNMLNYLQERIK